MTGFKFYTEVLERIRAITCVVELPSATVSLDDCSLALGDGVVHFRWKDEEIDVPLMCREVTPLTPEQLKTCAKVRGDTVSLRFPLAGSMKHDRTSNFLMEMNQRYKWCARDLKELKDFSMICLNCQSTLINSKDVSTISEMPSELWAEMMDFWHCHKPHDHGHDHAHIDTDRFSTLKPLKNAIITGSYYIAFNSYDDVVNVKETDGLLRCAGCDVAVGEHDKSSNLDKLFKWCFSLNGDTYPAHNYVYSSLLDEVNGSATRIVEFTAGDQRLLVWVFALGLDFVTRSSGLKSDAIKLYYTTDLEAILETQKERGQLESIDVPVEVLQSALQHLEHQHRELPAALQRLNKHWKMSLLYT